jgi:hypothetical protein
MIYQHAIERTRIHREIEIRHKQIERETKNKKSSRNRTELCRKKTERNIEIESYI